ncbi:hypothetical protein GQ53DRAFT_314019 [Thozetella sp. PMI_491]|nr:hypothetical protein GQ53DRAFT_314019 [Thozetella sp. PMI_491]
MSFAVEDVGSRRSRMSSPGALSGLALIPSRSPRARRKWDEGIPLLLRPLIRAYLLGYASAVGPRLLTLVLQHLTRRRHKDAPASPGGHQLSRESFLAGLQRILRYGLEWRRFPTFCAVIIGGSTILEVPLRAAFNRLAQNLSELTRRRISRWLASFIAGWLSIQILQSKETAGFADTAPAEPGAPEGAAQKTVRYAGRTLDLSLFAATRALDVIVGELWAQHKSRRLAANKWTAVEAFVSHFTDPTVFALSSGLIMWTWIYNPTRLPRAYNKWIGSAAAVDPRLTEALRRCRTRELVYGEDTGQAPLLGGMCADYKWPLAWGDPAKSTPFPCEVVHMGCGPSCEKHAIYRFARSFRWAMATYLPLNLLLVVRQPNVRGVVRALLSAARSSAFLGAFISLFYYGVCLARSRVGPRLLGRHAAACQAIDGGVCVGTGCFLCGWSILIEYAGRRKDMGLFVAPRALATLLPRRYRLDLQWRESLVFAFSTAVVFTCVLENKRRVRGVLGDVLAKVLRP